MATWNVFSAAIDFLRADLKYLRLVREYASLPDQDVSAVRAQEWQKIQEAKSIRDELEREMYAIWNGRRKK